MTTDAKRVRLPTNGEMQRVAANASHFLLQFAELQIAMGLGALVCFLLGRIIPASSTVARVYYAGSYLYATGDVLFLALPVVAWMIFRGHEWRHSLGMAIAMLVPVAAIVLVGELAGYAYLPWLITAGYPAMSVGMLVYMVHRADYGEFVQWERRKANG